MPSPKQSVGERLAGMATIYFIVGAVLVIWSGLWLIWLFDQGTQSHSGYYFAGGFLLTGLALIVGAGLSGPLGRSARQADMNPDVRNTAAPTPENPNPIPGSAAQAPNGSPIYTTTTTETR